MSTEAFAPAVFPPLQPPAVSAEREQARVRGYAEGHAEGYRAGLAAAAVEAERTAAAHARAEAARAEDATRAMAVLAAAARQLAQRIDELSDAAEHRIHTAAVELAELILATELADRGASSRAALRRAFAAVDAGEALGVRLHPDDLAVLEAAGLDVEGVPLTADETLAPGDAVVIVPDGLVDARVAGALERAREVVEESLR
ncbi:FliH/SctL family protein [Microbacterium sp. GXF7504]